MHTDGVMVVGGLPWQRNFDIDIDIGQDAYFLPTVVVSFYILYLRFENPDVLLSRFQLRLPILQLEPLLPQLRLLSSDLQ